MNTTFQTVSDQQAVAVQSIHPFLSVVVWELRRLGASRATWFLALTTFGVFLLVLWLQGTGVVDIQVSPGVFYGGPRAYMTVWDLLNRLGSGVVALLTILLFFLCTDGVARDLKQRTHELIMTTPLPTWAYIWGRYLSIVLVCLGLAVELLIAILVMSMFKYLTIGGDLYPAPHVVQIFAVWVSLVLPVVLFFSSLSFALGTLMPRHTNLVKAGLFIVWVIESFILPNAFTGHILSWYTNWDPSGGNILEGSPDRYRSAYLHLLQVAGLNHVPQTAATKAWALQLLRTLENQFVDFPSWFVPHLIWSGLALLIVVLAALTFQRFRNV